MNISTQKQPPLKIIPIWLRDTYARVQDEELFTFEGFPGANKESESSAKDIILRGFEVQNFFIEGSNLFGYFHRSLNSKVCNQTISIVIQGLRDLYWNNRDRLPVDEKRLVEISMNESPPSFHNIFDYKSLLKLREQVILPMFQVYGSITPYDIVHVPVRHFIDSINKGIPIMIELEEVGIIIQFSYAKYDFWDPENNRIIDTIDLTRCYAD
jgi:hypothetical protein